MVKDLLDGKFGRTCIYRGYVDDARNTDHAWMESQVFHFHVPQFLADELPFNQGGSGSDDIHGQMCWIEVPRGSIDSRF